MLSVPKSKSKDQKAGKEQKTLPKSTVVLNGGSGLPASAYNPLLGTFHSLDASSTTSPQILHGNGRFGNIDDSENHNGSTNGSGGDCDSTSNNDTRSVESEDQNKEKSNGPNKLGVVPGADNDKREKIRQKNERKHQRQKEKRAQELHERCNGYLMSRKLEALAQQLVSMGFSHERATMALILNEGRVEEAVSWLFDNHEDQNLDFGNSDLKIDISDEIARIADMEMKYRCSKQDVERVIVSCEGDLDKSEEALRSQKQEQSVAVASPKPEENLRPIQVQVLQPKPTPVPLILQRRDDKDSLNSKYPVSVGITPKSVPKSLLQPVTKLQPKLEWARPPPPSPLRVEAPYVQQGTVREPVVMMQRTQSVNTKIAPVTVTSMSSSPPTGGSWYPSSSEVMKSNGFSPHIPSPSPNPSPNPYYHPTQNQHHQQQQQHQQPFILGSSNSSSSSTQMGFNPGSYPKTISAASSLGLFSGLGSAYPVDWNTSSSMSSMPSYDYTSIDWSLDKSFLSTKPDGLWHGVGPYSRINDTTAGVVNLGLMRPLSSNGNGGPVVGLQDGGGGGGGGVVADSSAGGGGGGGSREWTSPFEGKDLFSLPRQFVFSPSL